MPAPSILALGDVHGKTPYLIDFLDKNTPDLVLQTGDLGLSINPSADTFSVLYLEKRLCALPVAPTIYCCDGNHEYWSELSRLLFAASPEQRQHGIHLTEHIVWMPRGSWLHLPDGRTVLFAGGAKSVDWEIRLQQGLMWWGMHEQLREEEINTPCPAPDIVVSHTAPASLQVPGIDDLSPDQLHTQAQSHGWDLSPDPSRTVLDLLYQHHRPARWLCGHFHCFADIRTETTHFTVLDCLAGAGQCWAEV